MRDDIHKNAPVPHRWKQVIRASSEDAHWLAEGQRRLDDAMRGELAAADEGGFFGRLTETLNRQAEWLPGVASLDELRTLGRPGNAIQDCILGHVMRVARSEGPGQVDIAEAVQHAANETSQRYFRATEEHCASEFPTQRRELMRRLGVCYSQLDVGRLAQSALDGSISAKPSRPPRLDLDEGLPLGRGGRPHA